MVQRPRPGPPLPRRDQGCEGPTKHRETRGERELTRRSTPGRRENRDSTARGQSTPLPKAKKSPLALRPRRSRTPARPATEISAPEAKAQPFFPRQISAREEKRQQATQRN